MWPLSGPSGSCSILWNKGDVRSWCYADHIIYVGMKLQPPCRDLSICPCLPCSFPSTQMVLLIKPWPNPYPIYPKHPIYLKLGNALQGKYCLITQRSHRRATWVFDYLFIWNMDLEIYILDDASVLFTMSEMLLLYKLSVVKSDEHHTYSLQRTLNPPLSNTFLNPLECT